jgi:membrane protease YdiL (CAAX protease family)
MNWRLVMWLVGLALPGVVTMSWLALPLIVDTSALPLPLAAVQLASMAQSTVMVFVAAMIGAALAPKTGLTAPFISALIARRPIGDGRLGGIGRSILVPGIVGGALGAAIVVVFHANAPAALSDMRETATIPLIVRVLYGGITEEVLIRWGLMSLFVWIGWRLAGVREGSPSAAVVWFAIALSAVLFGLGHLPAVIAATGGVTASTVIYVTVGNALFGFIAGYLFWRRGLEAAILAHCLAHLFAFLVHG